jgi:hypothetical protein
MLAQPRLGRNSFPKRPYSSPIRPTSCGCRTHSGRVVGNWRGPTGSVAGDHCYPDAQIQLRSPRNELAAIEPRRFERTRYFGCGLLPSCDREGAAGPAPNTSRTVKTPCASSEISNNEPTAGIHLLTGSGRTFPKSLASAPPGHRPGALGQVDFRECNSLQSRSTRCDLRTGVLPGAPSSKLNLLFAGYRRASTAPLVC